MSFPTGWGRKCALVIQASKVDANQVNFPVLLTEDTLPSEMFDADGSYPALSGGGDIRFSSDSAGNTRLSCEPVTFTIDNDPANGVAEIWVKVPSLSSSSNTTIYIWYNKSGESQPAIDAAYGAESVWDSNFKMVQHMEDTTTSTITDSTGNDNDGTKKAANEPVEATGQVGKGQDFDGADDYISVGDLSAYSSDSYTVSFWVYLDALDNVLYPVFLDNNSWSGIVMHTESDGTLYAGTEASTGRIKTGSEYITTGSWVYLTLVLDHLVGHKLYKAGALTHSNSEKPSSTWGTTTISLLDLEIDGKIDEFRISDTDRSAEWIDAEYNNQSDPSTFVIEGTPETPGGGSESLSFDDIDAVTEITDIATTFIRSLTGQDTESASSISSIALEIKHLLSLQTPASSSQILEAALDIVRQLNTTDLSSLTSISAPDISIDRAISETDISSLTELTDSVVERCRALGITDVSALTQIASVAVTANRTIGVPDISCLAQITTITVNAVRSLGISDLSSAIEITNVAIAAFRALGFDDVSNLTQITESSLSIGRAIGLDDVSSLTQITPCTLTFMRTLGITDVSSLTQVTQDTINIGRALGFTDAESLSQITNCIITAKKVFGIEDVSSLTQVTSVALLTGMDIGITDINSLTQITQSAFIIKRALSPQTISLLTEIGNIVVDAVRALNEVGITSDTAITNSVITMLREFDISDVLMDAEISQPILSIVSAAGIGLSGINLSMSSEIGMLLLWKVGQVVSRRTFVVPAEDRTFVVPAEDRTFVVT